MCKKKEPAGDSSECRFQSPAVRSNLPVATNSRQGRFLFGRFLSRKSKLTARRRRASLDKKKVLERKTGEHSYVRDFTYNLSWLSLTAAFRDFLGTNQSNLGIPVLFCLLLVNPRIHRTESCDAVLAVSWTNDFQFHSNCFPFCNPGSFLQDAFTIIYSASMSMSEC